MQTKVQMIKEILKSAFGLFIFSIGVFLTIQADIGLAPWDCLSMGASYRVGMSFGIVHTIISIVILGIDVLLKEKIGFQFGEPMKTEACLVLRPSSFRDFCKGEKGIFFIGEAAGFISPSSLEGISSAIYSARDLSRVLNHPHGDLNRRYWKKTLKIRIKIGLKLLKCPFMYNSFLRKLVLKSGLQSIKIDGTTNKGKNPAFSAK